MIVNTGLFTWATTSFLARLGLIGSLALTVARLLILVLFQSQFLISPLFALSNHHDDQNHDDHEDDDQDDRHDDVDDRHLF